MDPGNCDGCEDASHFHVGRKGSRADEAKFMFVLNRQNSSVRQGSLGLADIDNWTAAWLTTHTGANLSQAMKHAGITLDDVLVTNALKCLFPHCIIPPQEDYERCKQKYFDKQFAEFGPRKMIVFGAEAYYMLFPDEYRDWDVRNDRFQPIVKNTREYHEVPVLVMNHPSAPYWRGLEYREEMGELMKTFLESKKPRKP